MRASYRWPTAWPGPPATPTSRPRSTASGRSSPSVRPRSPRPTTGTADGHLAAATGTLRWGVALRAHRHPSGDDAGRVAQSPADGGPVTRPPRGSHAADPRPLAGRLRTRPDAAAARGTVRDMSGLAQQHVEGVQISVDG